jgi:hypothetical protein
MATTNSSGTMERILRLMAEKKASDVYLSAHSPALIKINGQCVPINSQIAAIRCAKKSAGRDPAGGSHGGAADAEGEFNIGVVHVPAWGAFVSVACASAAAFAAVFALSQWMFRPWRNSSFRPFCPTDHGKAGPFADGRGDGSRQEHHAGVDD